ncbi:MAG: hypothetical protein AAFQ87_17200, partial [Bacteroidota bacterium]
MHQLEKLPWPVRHLGDGAAYGAGFSFCLGSFPSMKRTKNQVRHDPASQAAPSPKWRTGQGS